MRNGLFILTNGMKVYYKNDLIHREDGPAIEYPNGDVEYFINDKYHRLDGPAIISLVGKYMYWYFNHEYIDCKTQEEFEKIIRLRIFW